MPKNKLPVYSLSHFNEIQKGSDFYINNFVLHLKEFHFVNTPHKHDFFLVILFTKGSGIHEIDFVKYHIKPNSIFFLAPGQSHSWKLSEDIDGYVFFHSQAFYDLNYTSQKLSQLPFYASIYNKPVLQLKGANQLKVIPLFEEILLEYNSEKEMKYEKICALVNIIYIELSRLYGSKTEAIAAPQNYLFKLKLLEELIEKNYASVKSPKLYAAMMHMSEKHLNRICKLCLNKTTTDLIADRVIIEAKRILAHHDHSIREVSEILGFDDIAYFSRFFKKRTALTPLAFINKYR